MTNIAMERSTIFNGNIHYEWALFNSYVKLPEGKAREFILGTRIGPDACNVCRIVMFGRDRLPVPKKWGWVRSPAMGGTWKIDWRMLPESMMTASGSNEQKVRLKELYVLYVITMVETCNCPVMFVNMTQSHLGISFTDSEICTAAASRVHLQSSFHIRNPRWFRKPIETQHGM